MHESHSFLLNGQTNDYSPICQDFPQNNSFPSEKQETLLGGGVEPENSRLFKISCV
jgi:hypothetical protein